MECFTFELNQRELPSSHTTFSPVASDDKQLSSFERFSFFFSLDTKIISYEHCLAWYEKFDMLHGLSSKNKMSYIILQLVLLFQASSLTHCGPATQYFGGSMLCKIPIFFTMKELPQI